MKRIASDRELEYDALNVYLTSLIDDDPDHLIELWDGYCTADGYEMVDFIYRTEDDFNLQTEDMSHIDMVRFVRNQCREFNPDHPYYQIDSNGDYWSFTADAAIESGVDIASLHDYILKTGDAIGDANISRIL